MVRVRFIVRFTVSGSCDAKRMGSGVEVHVQLLHRIANKADS